MRPPKVRPADGTASFPVAQWGGHSFGPQCCAFDAVSVQLWQANDGSLALTAVNTDANATLSFTATIRGHIAEVTHKLLPRSAAVLLV